MFGKFTWNLHYTYYYYVAMRTKSTKSTIYNYIFISYIRYVCYNKEF